jgi:hypothetical protein
MAIWQSAIIGAAKTGWLGRWVESQPEDPFLAISLGSILPPLLAGSKRSGSVLPLGGLKVPNGSLASDCIKLAIESRSDNLLQAMAAKTMRNLFTVSADITPILMQAYWRKFFQPLPRRYLAIGRVALRSLTSR